jgi:hypothetical protein
MYNDTDFSILSDGVNEESYLSLDRKFEEKIISPEILNMFKDKVFHFLNEELLDTHSKFFLIIISQHYFNEYNISLNDSEKSILLSNLTETFEESIKNIILVKISYRIELSEQSKSNTYEENNMLFSLISLTINLLKMHYVSSDDDKIKLYDKINACIDNYDNNLLKNSLSEMALKGPRSIFYVISEYYLIYLFKHNLIKNYNIGRKTIPNETNI